jgi:hypothetical protein
MWVRSDSAYINVMNIPIGFSCLFVVSRYGPLK